ncbi:hypothetical protein [Actinospica sp.]|jgi:hypothetical protein|uniref:hypothetical protein n=1 Tax=Actinospica sp. TaxID=1872142 RepID=UPI002C50CE91|nr:hypothetical protein [Actinospica sp.]HWG23954.1 hypothetical protein [Actinospica sp.]
MTTENPLGEQEKADAGRGAKGIRAFMKRPITLISTAAMVGVSMLGVVVLGDLSRTDTTTTTTVSSSRSTTASGTDESGVTSPLL